MPEAQKHTRKALKNGLFRFGAIFDADGDRVIFLDEKGEMVPAEFMAGLLMLEELKRGRRGPFVFTVNTSRGVREYIKEQGGVAALSRVGYVSVQNMMKQRQSMNEPSFMRPGTYRR